MVGFGARSLSSQAPIRTHCWWYSGGQSQHGVASELISDVKDWDGVGETMAKPDVGSTVPSLGENTYKTKESANTHQE